MKKIKKKKESAAIPKSDFKVWCERCSIRIAPNEEKVEFEGRTYHQNCYAKRDVTSNVINTSFPAGKVLRGPR
jgi:hypothetical protein